MVAAESVLGSSEEGAVKVQVQLVRSISAMANGGVIVDEDATQLAPKP